MLDLLCELGASLDIKNRQGLTPLTLAAVKAHKDVREKHSRFVSTDFRCRCSIISYRKRARSTGNMGMSLALVIRWVILIPLEKMVH